MAISFDNVPNNIEVPSTYLEIDNQNPFAQGSIGRILLVGTPSMGTTVSDDNRLMQVSSTGQAASLYGEGSALYNMVAAALQNSTSANIWCYAIESSVDSQWSQLLTVSLPGSAVNGSGTVALSINGVRLNIQVSGSDSAIAGIITSEVNRITSLPVTAVASNAEITFTEKTEGEVGNGNLITGLGNSSVTLTFAAATPATGIITFDPDVLGDAQFDTVVLQDSSTILLDAVKSLMELRWEATGTQRRIFGHAWAGSKDSFANHQTFLNARSDEHATVLTLEENNPTPAHVMVAAFAARGHQSLVADPALPFTGLNLRGVYMPALASQTFNFRERNALLASGGATIRYENGEVQIERAVTTATGSNLPDWHDVQTVYSLIAFSRGVGDWADQNYERVKLVGNADFNQSAGSRVVSPNSIKLDLIGVYQQFVTRGICEDSAGFASTLVVERPTDNQNRINVFMRPNFVNALRVLAIKVSFQY